MKYCTGKSNQAANTLSHCPRSDINVSSNAENEVYETTSYAIVSDGLANVINEINLQIDVKRTIQQWSIPDKPKQNKIKINSKMGWCPE